MKTIWLIGCGNIGFRHLQALLAMDEPARILVIEPAKALHDRISGEVTAAGAGHQVTLATELPQAGPVDLAVVATAAPPRAAIVRALAMRARPPAVILEKVLAQTDAELQSMADDLAAAGSTAHVNCPRRYFPGYQALRRDLAQAGPLSVEVTGSQFGLGSNAVHFLDLIEFLNASPLVTLDTARLTPGGKPSKRQGFQEIYGTLTAALDNGATLRVTCADAPQVQLDLAVVTADGRRYAISEATSRMQAPDGHAMDFGTRFVSQTPEIYADALAGRCALTPLADSLRQHRLYLAALRGHFGLAPDAPVPVS